MGTEPYQKIIMNLRAAIETSGMKQKVVAERANMSPRQLNDILGFRKRLNPADIPVFCRVLNITPDNLFEGAVA